MYPMSGFAKMPVRMIPTRAIAIATFIEVGALSLVASVRVIASSAVSANRSGKVANAAWRNERQRQSDSCERSGDGQLQSAVRLHNDYVGMDGRESLGGLTDPGVIDSRGPFLAGWTHDGMDAVSIDVKADKSPFIHKNAPPFFC